MASSFSRISTVLLLLLIAFTNTVVITAVPEQEYYSMLSALRFRGYHLFANAITTTDLHYEIITGDNFTFFAPIDSALYALDMTMSAAEYTTALRIHGVPYRLSVPELRMLPYGLNSFPTLADGHEIRIINRLAPIMVEGVNIALPGLFYDAHIAVHGLEGVIDFRSLTIDGNSTSNPTGDVTSNSANPTIDHDFESISDNLTIDRQFFTPSPSPSPVTANAPMSTPVESPAPVPAPATFLVSSLDTDPDTNSTSISVDLGDPQPMTYSESITQGHEEHMSLEETRPPMLLSQQVIDVSLAAKSTDLGEFTQVVDDKVVDCPVREDDNDDNDNDGKHLNNIADVHHGYLYTRELYSPSNLTCAE